LVAGLTIGCADAVSLSDPVEVATGNVEYQVQRNCVKFTIHGITLEEYTGEKENILFTELAQAATDTCWYGDCVVIDPENEGGGTWSEPSSVTYNKEYFARLTGYPRENEDGSIAMAVYCIIPGTGVLENNKVWNAVNTAANDIQNSLGVTLSDIAVLLVPLPTTTEWDEDKGEDKDEEGFSTVGIYIAIPCGVVGVAIMVIIKMKACCNKASVDHTSASRNAEVNKSNARAIHSENKDVRITSSSHRVNEFQFRYQAPPSYEAPPGYEQSIADTRKPPEVNQISCDEQTQEHRCPTDTNTQYTYAPVHTKY